MRGRSLGLWAAGWALAAMGLAAGAAGAAERGDRGHYAALTADWEAAAPFAAAQVTYGPVEEVGGERMQWWQLDVHKENPPAGKAMVSIRVLSAGDPLEEKGPGRIGRYIVHLPETGEMLEYRDVHTGRALLPAWRDFDRLFFPRMARGAGRMNRMLETATLLGHTLTLQWTGQNSQWAAWAEPMRIELDRELLVGTGRNFRDRELKRLPQTPQRQNYQYVRFTREEYDTMIEAGINLYTVDPEQSTWIRGKNVFYLRGAGGAPALSYPGDLYRSNYVGSVMFMDEPAIIMVGDKRVHTTLRYFSDAVELLQERVRSRYRAEDHYSAFELERAFRKSGVSFGSMRLEQWDYPAWETMYETANYQLAAGLAGIVHEGRYNLAEFDRSIAKWTEKPRKHTPEEMLRYHYAILRGAARANGACWGTSIYGQAEAQHSALALSLAYDMGARYAWFWTSDHDHHMPWPEQLALARELKEHAKAHPRGSMAKAMGTAQTAVAIPYGYFLELGDLWWIRALDKEMKNEHSQRFARVMREAHAAIAEAMDRKEDFDVVVDEGKALSGYRRVVRVSDGATARGREQGEGSGRGAGRRGERSDPLP